MQLLNSRVITNREIARNVFELTVSAPEEARCGQFYMLRTPGSAALLPRAISVCDVGRDEQSGALVLLIQAVGTATREYAALRAGDALQLTGPLGNGFDIAAVAGKRIALVGGGIGCAPMLLCAKELSDAGNAPDCYMGFRDEVFLQEKIAPFCGEVHIATESGATGHKGYITEILSSERYDVVFCCGPTPMMRATIAKCAATGTQIYVSLETKMACGIGGCLVCTCADKQGRNLRTCTDGPVFDGSEVDFDA